MVVRYSKQKSKCKKQKQKDKNIGIEYVIARILRQAQDKFIKADSIKEPAFSFFLYKAKLFEI